MSDVQKKAYNSMIERILEPTIIRSGSSQTIQVPSDSSDSSDSFSSAPESRRPQASLYRSSVPDLDPNSMFGSEDTSSESPESVARSKIPSDAEIEARTDEAINQAYADLKKDPPMKEAVIQNFREQMFWDVMDQLLKSLVNWLGFAFKPDSASLNLAKSANA